MREKLDNYKQVKGLLHFAKKTFLSDKGMEIMPTLENLGVFRQELRKLISLVDELGFKLTGELGYVQNLEL